MPVRGTPCPSRLAAGGCEVGAARRAKGRRSRQSPAVRAPRQPTVRSQVWGDIPTWLRRRCAAITNRSERNVNRHSVVAYADRQVRVLLPSDGRHGSPRVTLVIYGLGAGGAERVLLRLGKWLNAQGWAVTLLTLNPWVPDFYTVPDGIVRVEAPVTHSRLGPLNLGGHILKERLLRRAILATRPDVVVSFLTETNLRVLAALSGTRVPVVVSERVAPEAHRVSRITERLRRLLYPLAEKVVLVSAESLPWAEKQWLGSRLCAIANPVVSPGEPSGEPPEWMRPPSVVAMGRLTSQKGFGILIDAFAQIATRFPDWQLTIVGDGEDRAALEQQATRLRLAGRVVLPGVVEHAERALCHADVFALSSFYEGFPGALAEALAAGVPAVAFDCPGSVRQLVRHGEEGLLVPPGDVDGLASGLAELMGDDSRRRAMGARARDVVHRFSLDSVMAEWHDAILEAVATPPRRARDIAMLTLRG